MKKYMFSLLWAILLFASTSKIEAQGWIQDKPAMYSLGLGGTQALFLPRSYYGIGNPGSVGLALNIAGEYKIHRLIGIGWQSGLNIFTNGYYYHNAADGYYAAAPVIGIPIGFKFNFHILEATRAQIKDRLDVYAGFNVGGGPAFYLGSPGLGVYGFIYGGPQVGVRYWFDKVALFGELGWGATFANIGVTFR